MNTNTAIKSESFEAKISIDIQQTSYFFVTFYDFLIAYVILKKRKKSCYFKIWKKHKIRILEHWGQPKIHGQQCFLKEYNNYSTVTQFL